MEHDAQPSAEKSDPVPINVTISSAACAHVDRTHTKEGKYENTHKEPTCLEAEHVLVRVHDPAQDALLHRVEILFWGVTHRRRRHLVQRHRGLVVLCTTTAAADDDIYFGREHNRAAFTQRGSKQ